VHWIIKIIKLKMKNIITALLLIFISLNLHAEKFISEIKPLADEKWYGAYTAKAYCNTPLKNLTFQPYLANEKKRI
jgi:alpha-glucosidase